MISEAAKNLQCHAIDAFIDTLTAIFEERFGPLETYFRHQQALNMLQILIINLSPVPVETVKVTTR